jgi:hypothetical protein
MHIHPDIPHHCDGSLHHVPTMGNRWDGTTPTDTRSQRSRTSRRGGHLPTRARSPQCKNGLPKRVPRMPLFRTAAPYAQPPRPGQRNNTRAPTEFHTGYEPDRVNERPAAQGHPQPRPVPLRAGRPQGALPGRNLRDYRRPNVGITSSGWKQALQASMTAPIIYTDGRTLPGTVHRRPGDAGQRLSVRAGRSVRPRGWCG